MKKISGFILISLSFSWVVGQGVWAAPFENATKPYDRCEMYAMIKRGIHRLADGMNAKVPGHLEEADRERFRLLGILIHKYKNAEGKTVASENEVARINLEIALLLNHLMKSGFAVSSFLHDNDYYKAQFTSWVRQYLIPLFHRKTVEGSSKVSLKQDRFYYSPDKKRKAWITIDEQTREPQIEIWEQAGGEYWLRNRELTWKVPSEFLTQLISNEDDDNEEDLSEQSIMESLKRGAGKPKKGLDVPKNKLLPDSTQFEFTDLAFSPDGQKLAFAIHATHDNRWISHAFVLHLNQKMEKYSVSDKDGGTEQLDVMRFEKMPLAEGRVPKHFVFSPSGIELFAISDQNGSGVTVWNTIMAKELKSVSFKDGEKIQSLSLTIDKGGDLTAPLLVTGHEDGTVHIWEVKLDANQSSLVDKESFDLMRHSMSKGAETPMIEKIEIKGNVISAQTADGFLFESLFSTDEALKVEAQH